MVTPNPDEKLKKQIEKKMHMSFARTLKKGIDFTEDAWDLLDDILNYTIGSEMDRRLAKKNISLREWWTTKQGTMTGEQYTQKSVQRFAQELNKVGTSAKISAAKMQNAYENARQDTLNLYVRAARKNNLEAQAPILCDDTATTAKKTRTKRKSQAKTKKATGKRAARSKR